MRQGRHHSYNRSHNSIYTVYTYTNYMYKYMISKYALTHCSMVYTYINRYITVSDKDERDMEVLVCSLHFQMKKELFSITELGAGARLVMLFYNNFQSSNFTAEHCFDLYVLASFNYTLSLDMSLFIVILPICAIHASEKHKFQQNK